MKMKFKTYCLQITVSAVIAFYVSNNSAQASAVKTGLFGTVEIASNDLGALPQWVKVMESFDEISAEAIKCDRKIEDCQSQQMTLWRAKINELKTSAKRVKLMEINRFLNSWRHRSDTENYAVDDYWATPLEFMANGGDSEDFAIMKFISLKELGFSQDDMRIVVTNDVLRNNVHTVLSVRLNEEIYILDDLSDSVMSEKFAQYFIPLYSMNEMTRWAHIPKTVSVESTSEGPQHND
jgi:predicted transglutaminase-like cysteine proteinase